MRDPTTSRSRVPRPGRPTECIPSSRCQIILASPGATRQPETKLGSSKQDDNRHSQSPALSRRSAIPGRPGGARRDRTDDLMLAKHALSQLSYGPFGDCRPPARAPARQLGAASRPANLRREAPNSQDRVRREAPQGRPPAARGRRESQARGRPPATEAAQNGGPGRT